MEILDRRELEPLLAGRKDVSASIFLPTGRKATEAQQNPIRLKNMLRQAEDQMEALGCRARDIQEVLGPAEEMMDEYNFWNYQADGLALFLAKDFLRYCRTPFPLEELVVVNHRRFHVKPVLPLFTGNSAYYVLAWSQNHVRLVRCDRFGGRELDLLKTSIPLSIEEALQYDDPEKQLQLHSVSLGAGRRAVFHGHGAVEQVKDDLKRYALKIDRGIREVLGSDGVPLVLAGVDYLLPIYSEINTYPGLMPQGVVGNPDMLKAEELQQKAWPVVEPRFLESQKESLDRYREMVNKGLASADIREVVPEAHHGRVDTLFVETGKQVWGAFELGKESVAIHNDFQPGDDDLLDVAAQFTLTHSGTVFAGGAPDGRPVAAVFRY